MIGTQNMVNATVSHCKYGMGTIVDVEESRVTIEFKETGEQKKFAYPDAFEKFLSFEEEEFQKIFASDWKEVQVIRQFERKVKLQEYSRIEAEKKRERMELLLKKQKAAKAKLEREKREQAKLVKMIG